MRIWDAQTGKQLLLLKASGARVAWAPDGSRLALAAGKLAQVSDAQTGKLLLTCSGHNGEVTDVAWAPDGTRLASCSADKTIRIWSVPRMD